MLNYKVVETPKGARVICLSESDRLRRSAAHGRAVNQYSLDGSYIATYCSASEAARCTGTSVSSINRCCRHELNTANSYIWNIDTGDNRKNIA